MGKDRIKQFTQHLSAFCENVAFFNKQWNFIAAPISLQPSNTFLAVSFTRPPLPSKWESLMNQDNFTCPYTSVE